MARTKGTGGTKTLTSVPLSSLQGVCVGDEEIPVQTKWLKSKGLFGVKEEQEPQKIPIQMEQEREEVVEFQEIDLGNL